MIYIFHSSKNIKGQTTLTINNEVFQVLETNPNIEYDHADLIIDSKTVLKSSPGYGEIIRKKYEELYGDLNDLLLG